jgi:hypothetical protein
MSNSTDPTDTAFDWSPLGEQRWRELGEAAGCSELQLRFGVTRFQGASQTAAARLAGYDGDSVGMRRAGYAACRSTGVQNLLELAAINTPASAAIDGREIDAKIAKLIRSSDSNVSLKAMELHAKREAIRKEAEAAAAEETDLNPEQELALILDLGGIASAPFIFKRYLSFVVATPLFKLIAPVARNRFPELWQQWRDRIAQHPSCYGGDYLKEWDEAGNESEPTDEDLRAVLRSSGLLKGEKEHAA